MAMSTYEAIGAASATLQTLLRDRIDHLPGNGAVPVTLGFPGPDRDPQNPVEPNRVNLFLYQVAENAFLKNQEIPGHGSRGAFGRPPLSLVLYYLLTAYGSTPNGDDFADDTPAHTLLGSAMRVFHDYPVIGEGLVTERTPPGRPILQDPLRDEFESVKVTLQPLDLEDLSNVWTALELSFRPSVTYAVSVVQIESSRPRRHPRPVQELPAAGPRVHTIALSRPSIAAVAVRRAADPPGTERSTPFARIGDTLVVRGANFTGEVVARLGGLDIDVVPGSPDRLEIEIPDATYPGGAPIPATDLLQPGTQTIEVATRVPVLASASVGSGRAAWMLVPGVDPAPVLGTDGGGRRTITIDGTRLHAPSLPGEVVVGRGVVAASRYVSASPTQLVVPLPIGLPEGGRTVRVSGDLSTFPAPGNKFDVKLTFGGDGPHTVTLASVPATLEEAAVLIESALHATAGAGPAFTEARVTATGTELVILPGRQGTISVGNTPLGKDLRLTNGEGGSNATAYVGGSLIPLPPTTSATPAVAMTVGATTRTVTLPRRPTSPADTATLLQAAVQSAGPPAAFTGARVTLVDSQLLVIAASGAAITFAAAAGDPDAIAELGLAARYAVRVRVNGAESFDDVGVDLP